MLSQSGESGKAYGGAVSEMSLKDGQEFVWGIPRGSKEGLTWIGHPGKCQKKKKSLKLFRAEIGLSLGEKTPCLKTCH